MMHILNRPMVKEALVLIVAGVTAAMVCSKVYAASPPEAEQAAAVATTSTADQSRYQLAPMSKEQGREMLLSSLRGQVPLVGPTPAPGR
jgi:predicted alpha/beta hydrolase